MSGAWLCADKPDLAVERILNASERAFESSGIASTSMSDIAEEAGCSRATLYAYFPNRHQLRVAVVNRAAATVAREVADDVRRISDPEERIVEAVLRSIVRVRSTPALAAWFTPGDVAYATEIAASSDVLEAISTGFVAGIGDTIHDELRLAARWVVRVIVSLLTVPGTDESEERALVERFVVPGLVPGQRTPA